MQEIIERLSSEAPDATPHELAVSDWMIDQSMEELEATVREFGQQFGNFATELETLLGTPTLTAANHSAEIEEWYPEAIQAACWTVDDKVLCLALEHHDRDTPISVILRCLTEQELTELKM